MKRAAGTLAAPLETVEAFLVRREKELQHKISHFKAEEARCCAELEATQRAIAAVEGQP